MEHKEIISTADHEQIQRRVLSHFEMEKREQSIPGAESTLHFMRKRGNSDSCPGNGPHNSEKHLSGSLGQNQLATTL